MVANTKRFVCYVFYQPSNSSRVLTRMGRNESLILLCKCYHALNFMPVELAARRASAVLWSRDASTDGLFRVKLPKNALIVYVTSRDCPEGFESSIPVCGRYQLWSGD
jgi:hypothetical protein